MHYEDNNKEEWSSNKERLLRGPWPHHILQVKVNQDFKNRCTLVAGLFSVALFNDYASTLQISSESPLPLPLIA